MEPAEFSGYRRTWLIRVGLCQNALDDIGRHFLDQIGGVVYIELVDDLPQLSVGKTADQKLLRFGFQFGKGLGGELLGKQAEQQGHLLLVQLFKNS